MKKWVCTVCGYIYEGEEPPEKCPVCGVNSDKFVEKKDKLDWADEHHVGCAKGIDEDLLEDLRAHFIGECTEVGMYLAMGRVADREGYPEVGVTYDKIAAEEALHAAKIAELLGDTVVPSDKETGSMQRTKLKIAKKEKELGLDAIHNTIHEMCKDEARHGKAFLGLLERYFGEYKK